MMLHDFFGVLKHKHVQQFNRNKMLLLHDFTCFFLLPFLSVLFTVLILVPFIVLILLVGMGNTKKVVKSCSKCYLTGIKPLNVFFQKRREKSFSSRINMSFSTIFRKYEVV